MWEMQVQLSLKSLSTNQGQRSVRSSPCCIFNRLSFLMSCGFWPLHSQEYPRSSQSFPSVRTAGESSRSFTVTNKSNSLTHTVASSFVCTSPLAGTTVVGLLETPTVSDSPECRSFLLNMCIDAQESTTKCSFLRFYYGWRWETPFVGRWEKVALCFSLSFKDVLGTSPRVSAGTPLLSLGLPETYPQISRRTDCADEELWLEFFTATDPCFSRKFAWHCVAFVNRTRWNDLKTFVLFRKIGKDSGGSVSWNTQTNCRASFNIAAALLSPSLFRFFCWVDLQPACVQTSTYHRI